MLRPTNFTDPEAEGGSEAAELFSASPVPDRYSTPRVNLTAKSVFDVEPGSGPPAPIVQPLFPVDSHEEIAAKDFSGAEKSAENVIDEQEPSSFATNNTQSMPSSPTHAPHLDSAFTAGDLVWAQTDVQFAYWPALVIDPANLPDTLRDAYHFTSRGGKTTKIPVYFYGKNDYDVVLPARMKDYDEHRKALADQDRPNGLSGGLYVMFKRAMRLANENLSKDPLQRTEWIIRNRADPKDSISRANSGAISGNTSVSSAHGGRSLSRASSAMMHITTESHEGSTVYANSALQMSPLSDTYTVGGYTPTPVDGTKPTRFPFPEPVAGSVLHTVAEGADISPASPLDHVVPSLVDNLPPLTVLGSPRRTPSRSTSREGHVFGTAPVVAADHAALMAIASEAVDRALLDNYEIVDLSPSQQEDADVPYEAALSAAPGNTHVDLTFTTDSAEAVGSAETTAESPEHPAQSAFDAHFPEESAESTFLPPDHSESDVFSQISTGLSDAYLNQGHDEETHIGIAESEDQMQEVDLSEMPVAEEQVEPTEGDNGESVSADFLLDVPLTDEPAEFTEVVLEDSVENASSVQASLAAENVDESAVDEALVIDTASGAVAHAFAEPPMSFDQQSSPPRSPLPAELAAAVVAASSNTIFQSEASHFEQSSAENASFNAPAQPNNAMFGSTTPVRLKSPPRGDASSLFGAGGDAAGSVFDSSDGAGGDNAFGAAPPVASPPKVNAPAAADLFASPPVHDAFAPQAPPSMFVPAQVPVPAAMFAAAPHVAPIAPFTPKTSDASSLFGGNNDSELFGPPAPSLPPPPTQRVSSGGRAAVANTSAKGLFDAAPAANDLFGAPATVSATQAPVHKRVVSAKMTPTSAASDLFGSAPADSLFGGPAAPPVPAVRATPSTVSTAGVFGSSPSVAAPTDGTLSKKASFKGSPSRPVSDAASLFGGSSAASDPFSFGAAPAPAVSAAAMFSPPALVPAARTPVAQVPAVSAADLFGAPTPTATDLFGAPVKPVAAAVAATAAPPVSVPPPTAAVPVAVVPERSVTPVIAQPPFSPAFSVGPVDTASFFGTEPSPVPAGQASNPSSKPATPHNHARAESNAQDLFGAPSLKPSDSADSLFAAAAATTVQSISPPPSVLSRTATAPVISSTAGQLQVAAAVASEANSSHAGSVSHTEGAGAPAVQQPTLQRHASAGPVFKGRAKLVQGSSPFDTPAPAANTADVLFGGSSAGHSNNAFGASTANNSMFGAAPANDPFGAPASQASAFGAPSNSADLFSAPPPGAASPFTSTNNAKKIGKGKDKSLLSASDIFSSSAPVEAAKPYAAMVDPFSPPTAPGVKVAPKPAPALSIATPGTGAAGAFSTAGPNSTFAAESAFNSPAVGSAPNSPFVHDPNQSNNNGLPSATNTVPASTSGKMRTVVPPKGKKAPPPGMIATPHGYVPIASLNAAPAPATNIAEGINGLSKPLVNHEVLTSLVTETKESVAPVEIAHPVAEPVAAPTAYSTFNTPMTTTHATTATNLGARNNRIKPTAAIASFGFGGKLVVMLPKLHYTPVFNPAYGVSNNNTTEGAKHYNGPLRVYNVIDVVTSSVQGGYVTKGAAETTELCKLMTMFPGPLSSHQSTSSTSADTSATPSTASAEDLVRDALQHRVDCPLTGLLADPSAARPDTSSEKLLWSLLKLCVDRNGSLCSDNTATGGTDANPTHGQNNAHSNGAEVRICQLLMGHAAAATASAAGTASAVPNVAVFSGSASGAVTSYAPDMAKSSLLHANFHTGSTDTLKTPGSPSSQITPEQYGEIESLLVVGRKEDALRKAIQYHEWSLALLIGSVCGAEKYAEVVQSYSHSHFPRATPLHLLTLMYADLGSKAILNSPSASTTTTSSHTTITNTNGPSNDVLTLWRHNLSAILSNKPNNWQQLASFLGYRLQQESKDIFAAHSAYLTAGAYPTFPVSSTSGANRGLAHAHSAENLTELDPAAKLAGKYSLLGCDVTQAKHRALADCVSISALRATEILEYTLLKKLHSLQSTNNATNASGGDGIASIGKSLTDMFGWKGSSGGNNAAVPPKSPRRGTSAGAAAGSGNVGGNSAADAAAEAKLRYKVNKVRVVLCPLKVRFAMILSDFGLMKESIAYALEARALVQEIGVAEEKSKSDKSGSAGGPPGASGKGRSSAGAGAGPSATTNAAGEPTVKPFNRNFVRALDEFIDRLGVSDKVRGATTAHRREGSTGSASAGPSTTPAASSGGSLFGSMISNINLKNLVDMVDGPNAVPATSGTPTAAAGSVPAPSVNASANSNSIWNNSSPFDTPAPAASMPPPATRSSSTNLQSNSNMVPPSVYNSSQMSSVGGPPPHPAGHAVPPSMHGNNATAGNNAFAPNAAPASTAQYAPMSTLPPRPGNMVVPPSAVPSAGNPNANMGGTLSHSTSQSNLQSPPPAQYPQHGAPAYATGPPNNSYGPGGSDFFDEVDLASPDKQPHHHQQQHQQYNAGGNSSTPYGYPNQGTGPGQGNQGNQGNAPPPSQYPNQQAASWSSAGAHGAHSPAHGAHSPHTSQGGTPPTQQYSKSAPANNAAPPASGFFGFGGGNSATSGNTSAPQTLPPRANPNPQPQTQQNNAPPASARPAAASAAAAPAAAADDGSSGGGLFGGLRKSILARWYPDAHDANDNIGKSLEAVFNKETGRWEFPGEENAAPSAASLPPPTGPLGGGSGSNSGMSSLGVSPSPSMSAFGNVGGPPGASGPPGGSTSSAGGASEAYDPMAALMAPPSRRMPSSYSTSALNTTDNDPLAAMMAPPSSRYSLPHSSSTMSMNAAMPNINVWKPPPAPVSVMPVQRVMYEGDSNNPGSAYPNGDGNSDPNNGTGDAPSNGSGASLGPPPF